MFLMMISGMPMQNFRLMSKDASLRNFNFFGKIPDILTLRFKKVGDLWTIRVSRGYRALARKVEGIFIWFWIGTHDEYVRRI